MSDGFWLPSMSPNKMKLTFPLALAFAGAVLLIAGSIFLGVSLTPAQVFTNGTVGLSVPAGVAGLGGTVGNGPLSSQYVVRINVGGIHGPVEMYLIDYNADFQYSYNATVFLQTLAANPQVVRSSEFLQSPTTFDYVPKAPYTLFYLVNPTSVPATLNMTMTTYYQPLPISSYRSLGLIAMIPGAALIWTLIVRSLTLGTKARETRMKSQLS